MWYNGKAMVTPSNNPNIVGLLLVISSAQTLLVFQIDRLLNLRHYVWGLGHVATDSTRKFNKKYKEKLSLT